MLVAGLSACGATERTLDVSDPLADEPVYPCHGLETIAAHLHSAPTVAGLDEHPAAHAFAQHVDSLDEWHAVAVEDEERGAIRELVPPDVPGGEVREHERKIVTLLDEPAPPGSDEEGWLLSSSGPCALRADLGEREAAAVYLADATAATATTPQLEPLIVEQGCASGQDATRRVHMSVDADEDELRLIAAVGSPVGDQSCPKNPATRPTARRRCRSLPARGDHRPTRRSSGGAAMSAGHGTCDRASPQPT